ncbi:hypothetical protein SAMN05192579_11663 [Rhodanobacter glycinis]|uniref:Uncharacterized protein n=1 Tax=Rhodanobacter glycinis TaxID=582702 RepID=A0A1I4FAD5_9GAMM|nr:hypothetical protein SAMN05192579_11663 [Rhodanobacter glycinis]
MRVRRHPGRLHCASIAHRQIHQRRVLAATMVVIGEHWQNEFLCRRIVYPVSVRACSGAECSAWSAWVTASVD